MKFMIKLGGEIMEQNLIIFTFQNTEDQVV
jgi:hypothetical protein